MKKLSVLFLSAIFMVSLVGCKKNSPSGDNPAITAISLPSSVYCYVGNPTKVDVTLVPETAKVSDLTISVGDATGIKYYFEGNDLYILTSEEGSFNLTASYGNLPVQTCGINSFISHIEDVEVSPSAYILAPGQTVQLKAVVTPAYATYAKNPTWSTSSNKVLSVSETGLVTALSSGFAKVTVTVGKEEGVEKIWEATCKIYVTDVTGGTSTDQCGNSFRYVVIGDQTWMADNMKCNKYATESEAFADGMTEVGTDATVKNKPYYVDATNSSVWSAQSAQAVALYMKNGEADKLGYLYNWAAAVGVDDVTFIKKDFPTTRQGICPNGWHVPDIDEWTLLLTFINVVYSADYNGVPLKSETGWSSGTATNAFGFNALPAGYAIDDDNTVSAITSNAYFYSASMPNNAVSAYHVKLSADSDQLWRDYFSDNRGSALSVRCLKNN